MQSKQSSNGSLAADDKSAVSPDKNIDIGEASSPIEALTPETIAGEAVPLSKGRKTQILQQLANFNSKPPANTRKPGQKSRRNQAPSAMSSRGQQERQVDLQIWLLHQAMVNKLIAEPERMPTLTARLEEQLAAGHIRHGAYLFWSSAFALLPQAELFRAAILSPEPSANKYRRRTLMVGLLTEEERQQALLAQLPE